jgi:hypothetical protein
MSQILITHRGFIFPDWENGRAQRVHGTEGREVTIEEEERQRQRQRGRHD